MDLATRISELAAKTQQHREVLLTEQAAKTALVMPFLQALGYDVFDPGEVVPEFTADVGTKKGEKVDYAICHEGKVAILVECKPSTAELNVNHAGQLFRYFSVTDTRLAILTNGVVYQFYSDADQPNKMDAKPFFTFSMDAVRKSDLRILEQFTKASFNIDAIVAQAAQLKLESLVKKEIEKEFGEPSEDLCRLIAARVQPGRFTPVIREAMQRLIVSAFAGIMRDSVNDRLTSALNASAIPDVETTEGVSVDQPGDVITTEDEIAGFRIVQAIAAKHVDPKRIILRDAKSYCAILLDDNNRRTLARMHFNSPTTRYFGTFTGKEEARTRIGDLTDIYQHTDAIEKRILELERTGGD